MPSVTESQKRSRLPVLAGVTAGMFAVSIALIFFYAPTDPDQGISQRIFYFHVPLALTAYAAFGWGAWKALRLLWKHDRSADLESYVAIHQGVIFGTLTLLTGSIWARISWGVWWDWGDNQLVLFLVLFLFYSAYFMLRYSVDPGPARENMCAVYALFGVVLIPISFLAIRLAKSLIHPIVFTSHGPQMTHSQFLTFCVSFATMLLLFATLYQLELAGKRLDARLRELRELLRERQQPALRPVSVRPEVTRPEVGT
jgi:heme exporter protein C